MITPLSPLIIDQRLRERVTEAVIAQGRMRHPALNSFLRSRLGGNDVGRGALFAEPVIEGAAAFRSAGKALRDLAGMLDPRTVEALIGLPGDDYRFDYPAYAHQLEAWSLLMQPEPQSVLVSSGTGSGKTECFLVPLLDDLARSIGREGQLRGVRALMLYPLNALIASQEERLARWTRPFGGDIRFGLYNGLIRDGRKAERDKDEAEVPWQVLHRSTLRENPPPILVTNNTMLEYMTVRREDLPILEASQGKLRWIVIDEAHSYIGSSAAEVALLLRRVLQAFGVKAGDVRFVATSATIGDGEATRDELRRFLADLAGVPLERVHVVLGTREPVTLPKLVAERTLGAEEIGSFDKFAGQPAVQALVRGLEKGPAALSAMASCAKKVGVSTTALIDAVAGRAGGDAKAVLPLRIHQFVRAIPGLWSCLNPDCTGEKPEDWPFGAIRFEAEDHCAHCRAPVFEIQSCRECGEPWLDAYRHDTSLRPVKAAQDDDEFAAAAARSDDGDVGCDEDDDETAVMSPPLDGDRVLVGWRDGPGMRSTSIDPLTGGLPEARSDGQLFWLGQSPDDSCPRCKSAPSRTAKSPLWPFRFGAPFLLQNAAPTLLDGVSASKSEDVALPANGRQLLSFTDSRQGTARFAANIETMAERGFVRAFVYHLVQQAPAETQDPQRTVLEQVINTLRPLAAKNPDIARTLADKEHELRQLTPASASVGWDRAVLDLSREPTLKDQIAKVWDDDRDPRFKDPQILARFMLLRELARRPRRANSIETLGLAKLIFPTIESLTATRIPQPLAQGGVDLRGWQDFLYFLVDTVLRSNFALNIDRDDARWLLPRKAFLRNIAGPDQQKGSGSDATWPAARPLGNTSNAVRLLAGRLKLEPDSAQDRAVINDILHRAWDQLLPLMQGSGSTYALDFGKAALGPVGEAWICPLTNNILSRLVFGRSPNALRGSHPEIAAPPTSVVMPNLSKTFPKTENDKAAAARFVSENADVAALRARGVWGNLHDRAATFAPYIRAEEHSAQQPPYRLRDFERQFKRGEINLLACSTTMEMGVDIGSVETVLNTNVPPSIANYKQRVGRAGRRGQAFASSLTFARANALDREAFRSPVDYLNRAMLAPRVKLDSERIVQRHANALLLATWLREAKGQLTKLRAGIFYGYPDSAAAGVDEDAPVVQFCAWLNLPSTAAKTTDAIARLVEGSALAGQATIHATARDMFAGARTAYSGEWLALVDQAAGLEADAKKSIELQVRRMGQEFLLKELMSRSLSPGHGFPTDVVILNTSNRATRARDAEADPGEIARNRRYDYPSRNAEVGLREYAPGAEVVIDGLVWTSAGLILNWERPADEDAAQNKVQSKRWTWRCLACGETGCARLRENECRACGSTKLDVAQFIEPAGFRVDWLEEPHANTDTVRFIEAEPERISAATARWQPLLEPAVGRARTTGEGHVFHHSKGASKAGYKVCLDCGRAAEAKDDALTEHRPLMPIKGAAERCPGNYKTYAVTLPVALGHEVLTDVAELQFAGLENSKGALALGAAVRDALARSLGIEPRELGLGVDRRAGPLGGLTHSLFLYDRTSGGGGYATRLLDDFSGLLRATWTRLTCPRDCEHACSACVLAPDLFVESEDLDRRAALVFLEPILARLGHPADVDRVAEDAWPCIAVADAIARTITSASSITLYARQGFDLASLDQPPFGPLFAAVRSKGSRITIALAQTAFDRLDHAARAGLRDASHRYGFAIATAAVPPAVNGAELIALSENDSGQMTYWSRDETATSFGASWGVGADAPVIGTRLLPLPPAIPVKAEDLERSVSGGDRIRIIANDTMRPAKQFGSGFVANVLKPELQAADLWKSGELVSLAYSDRYLKAPLPVLLMFRVISALRDALTVKGAPLSLTIQTEPLKEDRLAGTRQWLNQNWPDESDRAETIDSLARQLNLQLDYDDGGASHSRKMTLGYADGTRAVVLFDQGFGYWKTISSDRHNFRGYPETQAKALLDLHTTVRGNGDSYVAVTRA